jgi:integrase
MTSVRLRYVHGYIDRHGMPRFYFRRAGFKTVRLPGLPGSEQFLEAYQSALGAAPRMAIAPDRSPTGSVSAAIGGYFASAAFEGLADTSSRMRRRLLEHFRNEHGQKRIAKLERRHIVAMMDAKAKTPGAARVFLSAIRCLMRYAVSVGLRADDPSAGIRIPKLKGDGFYTWSEQDIAAFEVRHPVGTKARLAFALLLYSAQRRADVVQMGRQHITDGMLRVRQRKTGRTLAIPIHSELRAVLDAMPCESLTFLVTRTGRPFHPDRFTHWFADRCKEAGLPPRASVHGLRKAAARRLAEAGCSASVIASISGHASLREVQRYVAGADQMRLAVQGIEAIKGTRSG